MAAKASIKAKRQQDAAPKEARKQSRREPAPKLVEVKAVEVKASAAPVKPAAAKPAPAAKPAAKARDSQKAAPVETVAEAPAPETTEAQGEAPGARRGEIADWLRDREAKNPTPRIVGGSDTEAAAAPTPRSSSFSRLTAAIEQFQTPRAPAPDSAARKPEPATVSLAETVERRLALRRERADEESRAQEAAAARAAAAIAARPAAAPSPAWPAARTATAPLASAAMARAIGVTMAAPAAIEPEPAIVAAAPAIAVAPAPIAAPAVASAPSVAGPAPTLRSAVAEILERQRKLDAEPVLPAAAAIDEARAEAEFASAPVAELPAAEFIGPIRATATFSWRPEAGPSAFAEIEHPMFAQSMDSDASAILDALADESAATDEAADLDEEIDEPLIASDDEEIDEESRPEFFANTDRTLRNFFAAVERSESVTPPAPRPVPVAPAAPRFSVVASSDDKPRAPAPQPRAAAAPEGLTGMEMAVERLAEQFERTATRSFDSLESCLTEIMRTIESSRAISLEVAEAAADRTIKASLDALGTGSIDRLEDIAIALADLHADTRENERRTCDMLAAVRETLEQVAARLPERPANAAEESTQSLIERARAAAAEAAAESEEALRLALTNEPTVVSIAPRQHPKLKTRGAPERGQSESRKINTSLFADPPLRMEGGGMSKGSRKFLFASTAALLLVGTYAGAYTLLGDYMPDETAVLESGEKSLARAPTDATPAAAGALTTADANSPANYRPVTAGLGPLESAHGAELIGSTPDAQASNASISSDDLTAPAPQVEEALLPLPKEIGSARLRASALAGDGAAEFEIGMRFASGRGVERNMGQAAAWFGRAAEQGLAPAQYRLASMTEKGTGVAKDLQAARGLYEQAASAGNLQAMHNLGVLHAEGGLGTPDMAVAQGWFHQAAELGLKDSQFNLGIFYTRGLSQRQNLEQAYLWFSLAAKQGDKDAQAKRDQIAAKLQGEQLAKAEKLVAEWQPRDSVAAANEVAMPASGWDDDKAPRVSDSRGALR